MSVWPVSLPQVLLTDGYEEMPPNTALRTEMDAGPAKLRQRYTAGPRPISGAVMLNSKTQLDTIDAFYITTLKGGTLTFAWEDRNGASKTYAFVEPPKYEFIEPEKIKVALKLEIRP